MDAFEEVLPPEVNLVRFGQRELLMHKTQIETEQIRSSGEKDCSLTLDNDSNDIMELKYSDVLDRILPARQWEENGKHYRQKLSNQPSTKKDVNNLTEKLDMYLEQFKAREVGICPIKEQLYLQCFNEIIRQVAVSCPERGSLLIRLRDDMKMNINCYRKLYESVTAKGIRKALLSKEKKSYLEKVAQQLMSENEKLEAELAKTIAMTEQIERGIAEAREAKALRHAENLVDVRKENDLIKDQLKSMIAPEK